MSRGQGQTNLTHDRRWFDDDHLTRVYPPSTQLTSAVSPDWGYTAAPHSAKPTPWWLHHVICRHSAARLGLGHVIMPVVWA